MSYYKIIFIEPAFAPVKAFKNFNKFLFWAKGKFAPVLFV